MTVQRAPRPAPFSMRLSAEERARLLALANNVPLGAYVKSVLFAADAPRLRSRRRVPAADQVMLAELLAKLGASRLASNLNQLAHQANLGTLEVDAGTAATLRAACDDVRLMRRLLMRALGLKPDGDAQPRDVAAPPVAESFGIAARKARRIQP